MQKESLLFNRNILLIGFMGSGKSSVSRDLAKKIGAKRIDIDELILKISGQKTISEIFIQEGESRFREYETLALVESLTKKNQIIATGGGTLIYNRPENLIKNGILSLDDKIVFLNATFETCKKRCQYSDKRPLFKDLEKALNLFNERFPQYKSISNYTIEIDNTTSQEISKKIINFL